jgi:hypothetical protein
MFYADGVENLKHPCGARKKVIFLVKNLFFTREGFYPHAIIDFELPTKMFEPCISIRTSASVFLSGLTCRSCRLVGSNIQSSCLNSIGGQTHFEDKLDSRKCKSLPLREILGRWAAGRNHAKKFN